MKTSPAAGEPAEFTYFPLLPAELRLSIWEWAAATRDRRDSKVIRLHYNNGRLAKVSVPLVPLQITCRDSHESYKKSEQDKLEFYETAWRRVNIGNGEAFALQTKRARHEFPVNFDHDFFFITGQPPPDVVPTHDYQLEREMATVNIEPFPEELPVLYRQIQPFIRKIKNLILPAKLSQNISDLFHDGKASQLVQLQELRVLLKETGERLWLEPGTKFQHHCPRHHHDVFPSTYFPLDLVGHDRIWDGKMPICPACDWECTNWGYIDRAAMRCQYLNFRVTYDASLSPYPRLGGIFNAGIPIIRWVRKERDLEALDNSHSNPDQAGEFSTNSVASVGCGPTCLIGNYSVSQHS